MAMKQDMDKSKGNGLDGLANDILEKVGGELTAETMGRLDSSDITLLAYWMFRGEMMEGGMVQLIHNGYGPFIFENPFAKAMRLWGLKDFSKFLYAARKLYERYRDRLTADCSDEEFMALYEQCPEFDEFDDEYVEQEKELTAAVVEAYCSGNQKSSQCNL